MKKTVVIYYLLFEVICLFNHTSRAYAGMQYYYSKSLSLSARMSNHNRTTFLAWNYLEGVWKDSGLNGAYAVGMDRYLFKSLVGELSSTWTTSEESISRLYSLVGFSRAFAVLHPKSSKYFNIISYNGISPVLQNTLEPYVNFLQSKYEATLSIAQKYSLITAFEVSWEEAVSLMTHICPEGAFSHEYSVEEALFIIHMKAKSPSVFEKSFWSSTKYNDEQLLYAKCLVGALAKVLKIEGTISGDFGFSIGTNHDPKTLLFENAIRFLSAYAEGNPEFSKKPPAGVDIPAAH